MRKEKTSLIIPLQVDRTIPVVEGELPLRRRFYQTRENNLKQNHLWISVFSRSPRSRYTRCQRVTAAFLSLFLRYREEWHQAPRPGLASCTITEKAPTRAFSW